MSDWKPELTNRPSSGLLANGAKKKKKKKGARGGKGKGEVPKPTTIF